jgi:hypothetical protein
MLRPSPRATGSPHPRGSVISGRWVGHHLGQVFNLTRPEAGQVWKADLHHHLSGGGTLSFVSVETVVRLKSIVRPEPFPGGQFKISGFPLSSNTVVP